MTITYVDPNTGLVAGDLTPEEQKYNEQQTRGGYMAYGSAPLGVGEALTPVGKTKEGKNVIQWLPGFAYGLYSAIGHAIPDLTSTWIRGAAMGETGLGPENAPNIQLRPLPGAETAQEKAENATRFAEANIPHPQPQNPEEELAANVGRNIGTLALPLAPEAAIAKLPSVAALGARLISPAAKDIPAIAALGTGLTTAATVVSQPAQAQPPPQPSPEEIRPQTPQQGPSLGAPVPLTGVAPPPAPGQVATTQAPGGQPGQPGAPTGPLPDAGGPSLGKAAGIGALGLLGGWGLLKFGPRMWNLGVDALESARGIPTKLADINAIRDEIASGNMPSMSVRGGTTPDVPLPQPKPTSIIDRPLANYQTGSSTNIARNVVNQNAVLNQVAKAITSNTDDAEALIARNNMVNYPAGNARQMESQFRTGISPSGYQGPSRYASRIMVDGMTDDQRQLANQAAWAKNELDNRGVSGQGPRVNYPQYDSTTLRSIVQQAENDPQIALYLSHNAQTGQFIIDDMERMGFITKDEASRARRLNPNFMPTLDSEGNLMHSWTGRDVRPGTGFTEPPVPAWEAMDKYYDTVYRQATHNAFVRDTVLRLDQFVKANPEYRHLLYDINEAPGALRPQPGIGHNMPPEPIEGTLQPHIKVQTSAGPRTFVVNNRALLDSLKTNREQLKLGLGTANAARRLYQNATTGPLALAGGTAFAAKNFLRDVLQIPVQAKPGMYTGYFSKMAGGRLPVYDPTFPIIAGRAAIGDTGAVLSKTLADALASSDHPLTQAVRAIKGQAGVDAMRNWFHNRYLNSRLEARTAAGVGGGGSFGQHEMTVRGTEPGVHYSNPLGNQVAPLVSRPNLEGIAEKVPLGKGAVTTALNLRQLIHDLHGVISDAPHSGYHDINLTNPRVMEHGRVNMQKLGSEVQQVIGDPGTRGAKTGFMRATTPYLNTGLQAVSAAGRVLRDHPGKVLGTAGSAALIYSLAEQLTALVSGKEHVDHLENRVSNQQREANIHLYHGPGTDPNNHTEISLPQEQRAIKPIIDEFTSAILGTYRAHEDEPILERTKHMLADIFQHHTSTELGKRTALGLTDMLGFPVQLPQAVNVITSLLGADTRDPARQIVTNLIEHKPLTSGIVSSDDPSKVPGQQNSTLVSKRDQTYLQSVLSALLGTLGTTGGEYGANAYNRYTQTHDLDWVRHGLASDVEQNLAKQNPYANVLFGKNLPMSTRGAGDERIDRVMDNLRSVQTASGDQKSLGYTRAGGQRMLVTGNKPGPDMQVHPEMQNVYTTMSQFARNMNSKFMPQVNDIYKQIQSEKDSIDTADEKQRVINNLTNDLAQRRRMMLDEVDKLNHVLSGMTGRHVDVARRIDWNRGFDQFPED